MIVDEIPGLRYSYIARNPREGHRMPPSRKSWTVAEAAAKWLTTLDSHQVAIAREIIRLRAVQAGPVSRDQGAGARWFNSGEIYGMTRALSMLGDRPGDISSTGAGGLIDHIDLADQAIAEGAQA
jgi:hypothetical protein